MKRRAAIVDTNVMVSGILAADTASPAVRIVEGMRTAAIPFVLSAALVAEYHSVLSRPAIVARHRMSSDDIDAVLFQFARDGQFVEPPPPRRPAPDANDAHLYALLEARPDAILVTGDALLLRHGPQQRVVLPRAFIESLGWASRPGSR